MARHGIKVRDFAYESNLPLIPSIPRARKVVLGTRPLKRTKRYFEESDDVFTVNTQSQSQSTTAGPLTSQLQSQESDWQYESVNKSRPLERKSTEPVIIPERESQRPYREVGYADLSQHPSSSQAAQRNPRHTLTPTTPTAVTKTPTKFSPVSLPFPFPATKRLTTTGGGSQESELSTDTPLVTPKGSLTWPSPHITSDLPASQLDNNISQVPALDTMPTYSQLGLSPPFSQAPDSQPDTDTAAVGTAIGSPPTTEVVSNVSQLSLDHIDPARGSSPPSPSPSRTRPSRISRPTAEPGPPLTPDAGGPRYFLRKHGSPGKDHDSSPSLRRRHKSSAAPYPGRVPPVTRQSAHAASSDSPGRSARARPLRKATTTS